ncbi:flagellar basal-body rod protein FlgF [Polaromonas sp. A23]|uniref:flagellar basal-body rod protein FlgF n=1 Tax=Polaromonas sp. A23 TaxID=1944133 RepID=UPI0009878C44|nr:flagellar basal-body rod protein FlgF [Polaromonas sp. A23]OOG44436.1 flagellar basal-body rod protein FlgF [Polaromonas sp. A23]
MLDSIYVALTGLSTFQKGLNTISNNVANLNTPGYKGRELLFSDLYYRYEAGSDGGNTTTPYTKGSGVTSGGEHLLLAQGTINSTGNDLDLAINGNGFFVLNQNGEQVYTRDGQFEFNSQGILKSRGTDNSVLFLNGSGGLNELDINTFRTSPGKATTTVTFKNGLSTLTTPTYTTTASVFDSAGGAHTISLTFTNNTGVTAGSWLVDVAENSVPLTPQQEIRFNGVGLPIAGFDQFSFAYQPSISVASTTLNLNFSGTAGLTSGASSLALNSQNGFGPGALLKATFDTKGTVKFAYSNGQTVNGPRIALAAFNSISALQPLGGNLFKNANDQPIVLGNPGDSLFGTTTGGSLESSNVDLAGQFSQLIVAQRGYQAASEVITAANEMLQQLLQARSGK